MAARDKFHKYKLLKPLATGGMGTIYLARVSEGPGAGRIVVLKCISPEHSQNPEYRKLFESEIKVMLGLSHPNIVTLLDAGEEDGTLFITLDWVEGRNLRQLQTRSDGRLAPLDPRLALAIGIEVAKGLNHAHAFVDRITNQKRPIIHRDISPTNILIGFDGAVKIIDFGIAKTLTSKKAHTKKNNG